MSLYINIYKKSKQSIESMVIKISIPLLLVFIGLYLFERNIMDFKILVDLYSVVGGGALMILLFLMRIENQDKFIRYLSWGYLSICLFLFIRIEMDLNFYLEKDNLYYLIGALSSNIFEILVIKLAGIAYRNDLSIWKTMKLFVISYISIVIFYRILFEVKGNYNYFYIHILLCAASSAVVIFDILNFKEKFKRSDYLPLLLYVVFQLFYDIVLYLNILLIESEKNFWGYLFKFLAFLCVFWLMEKRILRLSYMREVEVIISRQIERKKLNISLKNQERALEELEIQTRHSVIRNKEIIDKIPEQIFIFKNNYLEYMNKYGEEYLSENLDLSEKLDLNSKFIRLDSLLDKIIEEKEYREAIYNGSEKHIVINDKKGKRLNFKVSLVVLNENNKVLIMKSNKDEVENLEIMQKYNYILKEEEIMEEFYANISHELRTPINVIYSALQLNAIYIDDNKQASIIRNYSIIKQNCKRLIRTINNFIDSNKISEGYLDGNKKVFNVVYLIDEIVEASTKYMKMKNNVIIFDPQEEQVFIYGSVEHTVKVILNILSNALKYGEENSEVFIVTYIIKGFFYLEIVYRGEPIPEKKLSYVFRKFTKLDDYLSRTSEGSGLGLFLAKKLVEQNGGTIDIFSDKIGNVATITLPITNGYEEKNISEENNFNDIMDLVDIEFSDIYF